MITYTPMKEAHVAAIAQLEKECFSDPWSEKSIASELSNPLSCWLVALDGETVAGYIGSQTVLGESDMMNIAVSPVYRRQGIAKGLIEALIECLKARESHCLTLEVRASNEPAKALYAALGFCQVGLRRGYYQNPKEDAQILRKEWSL